MNFSSRYDHDIPLFIKNSILPVYFLYIEYISIIMYNVKNKLAPVNISNVFKYVSNIHGYNTRSAAAGKFYVMHFKLEIQRSSFSSFSRDLVLNYFNYLNPCRPPRLAICYFRAAEIMKLIFKRNNN